jgi:hypothetical protein
MAMPFFRRLSKPESTNEVANAKPELLKTASETQRNIIGSAQSDAGAIRLAPRPWQFLVVLMNHPKR